MNNYFDESISINLYASMIGISKDNWIYVNENSLTIDEVKGMMVVNNFDVIPILNSLNQYKSYYFLEGDLIKIQEIEADDQIYFLTTISDLIRVMIRRDRKYFFLHDYTEIIGLVSNVNFLSKSIYTYFYSLLSNVEIGLARFISDWVSEDKLLEFAKSKSARKSDQEDQKKGNAYDDVYLRFEEDQKEGLENSLISYFHLSQYENIIEEFNIKGLLKYESFKKFKKDLKGIKKIRNWIVHPVNDYKNSLVSELNDALLSEQKVMAALSYYNSNQKLLNAYVNETVYTVEYKESRINIIPYEESEKLSGFLEQNKITKWCIITAWNPMSDRMHYEQNQKLQDDLLSDDIIRNNAKYKAVGSSINQDWKEESVFVSNISKQNSILLGRKYKQKAILYGEKNRLPEIVVTN